MRALYTRCKLWYLDWKHLFFRLSNKFQKD